MPAPVVAAIITAAAGTASTIYGAKASGSAAKRAAQAQERANQEALSFEREQAAEQRRQFDLQLEERRKAHEAEQAELNRQAAEEQRRYDLAEQKDQERYAAKEARLAPYREAGALTLKDLAARASQPSPQAPIQGMSRPPMAVMEGAMTMRDLAQPPQPPPLDLTGLPPHLIAALKARGISVGA